MSAGASRAMKTPLDASHAQKLIVGSTAAVSLLCHGQASGGTRTHTDQFGRLAPHLSATDALTDSR